MFEHRRKSWTLILLGLSALLISACQGEFTIPLPEPDAPSEVSEIELSFDREGFESEFVGTVDRIGPRLWIVAGQELEITPATEIKGALVVGQLAKVHARLSEQGTLIAREIEPAKAADDDGRDGGFDEIEFFGAVESQQTGLWRIGGREVQITPSTEVKGLIGIGDLVKVHARPGPGGGLVAREIEPASADDLLDDDEHDLDDERDEVKFWGIVQEIGSSEWRIGGRIVRVTSETEIDSGIKVGDFVKVEASQLVADALVALEIESSHADHEADDDHEHDDREHDDEEHDEEDHDDEDHDEDDDHDHEEED